MDNGTVFSIEVTGVKLGTKAVLTFGEQDLDWFEGNSATEGFVTTTFSLVLDSDDPGVIGSSNAELSCVSTSDATTLGEAVRWAIKDARDNNVVGDNSRSTRLTGGVRLTAAQIRELALSAGYTKQRVMVFDY